MFAYLQHAAAGKDRQSNWLPAPDGPMCVAMRLYRPKQEALSREWKQAPQEVAN